MRILVFSEVFWPENFLINDLVQEWVHRGFEVEVISQYPSYPQGYVYNGYTNQGDTKEVWEGIVIHRFPFIEGYSESKVKKILNYRSFVKGGESVIDTLDGKKYNALFVSQTGPITVAYPAIYAKKKWNIPLNIWTCDIWPDAVYGYGFPKNIVSETILNTMIRKVYRNSDNIFISSKSFADTIAQYTNKKCIYAPNWLKPVKSQKSRIQLPSNVFNFTFTGNVSRYQNLINTIEGFYKADLPNAQLNIIGDGSYIEEVKTFARRLNAINVVFHGKIPYEEIDDVLNQSNALILPLMSNDGIQKTEPFKIQSYLKAGKPILGILNGAGKDIIEENNIGLCVQPDNVINIADGFREMIDFADKNQRKVMQASQVLMQTRFNKKDIVDNITNNLVLSH